jgi:predicted dehydrogenase
MKKKLEIAVLGLGYFGKNYVRLLQKNSQANLAGVADDPKQSIQLLRSLNIDGVVIATPAESHYKLAKEALALGKHVLLEKPMVVSAKEAVALQKAVKKSGKILMVGHQYFYNDYIRHLKKVIDQKKLGKISYVVMSHFYTGPIRKGIGCFFETATHELSMLEYLFGDLKLSHIKGNVFSFTKKNHDDFASATFRLPKGIQVNLMVSWFMPKKVRSMAIVGSKGMALFDDTLAKDNLTFIFTSYPNSEKSSYFFSESQKKPHIPKIKAKESLANQLQHFIDCISHQKNPLTNVDHGVRITKALEAITSKL